MSISGFAASSLAQQTRRQAQAVQASPSADPARPMTEAHRHHRGGGAPPPANQSATKSPAGLNTLA
jgi:hypothetical protein